MAVVVEPTVSKEKLLELLAEQAEQSCLDYKTALSIGKGGTRDTVELAKDIAAMQAEPNGGYIVIGVDDHGNVVPDLTPDLARHFDEATVGRKVGKYLDKPVIRVSQHEVDGHAVVLLHVAPSEYGWCIFRETGEYEEELLDGRKKKVVVFHVGDVFVRHGTRSERWLDADRDRLVRQIVERRKDAYLKEAVAMMTASVDLSLTAQRLEQLPVDAVTWRLDAETFDRLVTELLRRGDEIPLLHLLNQAPRDAAVLLREEDEDLRQLLNRLTSMAALALQFDRVDWLDRVLQALEGVYGAGFGDDGHPQPGKRTLWLWIDVITRVQALGALAVRRKAWTTISLLADRRPDAGGQELRYDVTWFRHAAKAARQAATSGVPENRLGLLARARNVIREVSCLHPDLPADDERVLNSLCQFDFYACLVGIARHGLDAWNFFPNFALYYEHRTTPAAIKVIRDDRVRQAVFPADDQALAAALVLVDERARAEFTGVSAWDDYDDRRVYDWIADHQATNEG